ncbi:GAF domain-containing sensor histidine kinase, partial [Sulfuricella sp.]|uniref:GAF domain-containing sensor histidine kinase n=1 Tax=Sulfuricella sp. TaxID=2099377 RepID=UPI002D184C87
HSDAKLQDALARMPAHASSPSGVPPKKHPECTGLAGNYRWSGWPLTLRQEAETKLAHDPNLKPRPAEDLLHELQVHQVELEMQNENLRQSQVELEAAHAQYFDLYDLAPVGYCTLSERGLILQANLTAATLLGLTRCALTKQLLTPFILKEDQNIYYLFRKRLLGDGKPQSCELRMVKKDGAQFWVHLAVTVAKDADGAPVLRIVLSDITKSKTAERQIRRLNNLYAAISRTNEAIVQIRDRDLLLQEICRIAIEYGQFKLAWIGLVDDETSTVKIAASSGEAIGYLDNIYVSIDADKPEGCGPVGMTIRDKREYVFNDFLNDPRSLLWQENARKHGLRAVASCPLELEGQAVGALTLYAEEANFFDQELTKLLSDLSRDISLALNNFVREDRRKLAEERLNESYKELEKLTTHLEAVREEEQKRIARELHDEMGGVLAALNVKVSLMAAHPPTEMTDLMTEMDNLANLVAAGIQALHRTVTELRPCLLDEVGLTFAIKRYVQEFERNTGIECDLRLPEEDLTLDGNQSTTIFRIIQESLTNVAKHAKASRVSIALSEWGTVLMLTVTDNGKGFDLNTQKTQSFGLLGIRERAAMVGGKAQITSASGKGTTVRVSLPWIASRPEDAPVARMTDVGTEVPDR